MLTPPPRPEIAIQRLDRFNSHLLFTGNVHEFFTQGDVGNPAGMFGMTLGIGDIVGGLPISVKANGMVQGFWHSKCDFKFLHPKNLSLFVGGKGALMPGVPVARDAPA